MHINYSRFMHWKQGAALLLALGIFAFNLRAMAPTITAGDSSELSTAQFTLGIAHSPGYPFFVLTGKAFTILVPFGNPAYRTNLFSVFLSFFITIFLFRILIFWTNSVWLSGAGTLFFLFVPVIREQFLTTEVFALNLLVAVVILFFLSSTIKESGFRNEFGMTLNRLFCLVAFIFGLGMGNQHTLVLLLPSLVLFFYLHQNYPFISSIRYLLFPLPFFVMGVSVYLFLPIRSFAQPLLDWEDPQTWERFWGVLTRARYGTFQLAQGQMADLSIVRFIDRTIFLLKELFEQMSQEISLLLFIGVVLAFFRKESRWFASSLFLLFLFSGPFFLMLSNVGTGPSGYEILSRFLPMPFLAFFLIGLAGLSRFQFKSTFAILFFVAIFFIPSIHSLRAHYLVFDLGRNVLKTLPEKSLLFADRADEVEFSLAYLFYAEGRRKDIQFVDCNAGVTRSIYGEHYYRIWGKPRLAIREIKERELIQKSETPVYYATVEPEMIAIPRRAEGILFRATAPSPSLPYKEGDGVGWWDEFYLLRYDLRNLGFRGIPLFSSYAQLLGNYFLQLLPLQLSIRSAYPPLVADASVPKALQRQKWEATIRHKARWIHQVVWRTNEEKLGVEKSRTFFQMLSLSEPTGAWNHSIALQYMAQGEQKLAEEFFLKALRRGSEKDKVLCNLGILYERMGRIAEAKESYQQALELNPNSSQAHYNLGVLYWKDAKWQEVVREFEAVLKIEPNHSDAKRYLQVARQRQQTNNGR